MTDCISASQKPSNDGYCRTTIRGKTAYAHRIAYEKERGKIPLEMTIDHLCRNKSCVNVRHLEVVTKAENSRRKFIGVTHCKNGHEYTQHNTMSQKHVNGGTYKRCRTCYLVSKRKYNKRIYYEIKTNS